VDINSNPLGTYPVVSVLDFKDRHTQLVKVSVPASIAKQGAVFGSNRRRSPSPEGCDRSCQLATTR
jgi:hypothetical protein